jgi:DNA-binding SARP family transcriptional activator
LLFGKFQAECDDRVMANLCPHRAQELLCYLLLHRDRPHPREALTDLLCSECPGAQSKKSLRQALWQLQTALDAHVQLGNPLLSVEPEWICLNQTADLWLDVAVFEQAFATVQGVGGETLDSQHFEALREAVALYRGDLLEGWYQDWCLYQRERLQNMYLAMLDKLMGYCEANRRYEEGMTFGACVLRLDHAHERTHQRLMRLHYLAGDRATALHQYERCAAALKKELGVQPAKRTTLIYEQIRSDSLDVSPPARREINPSPHATLALAQQAALHLGQLQVILVELEQKIQDLTAFGQSLRE